MEAKIKVLRVADLRELLQKASVPIPAKSNKSDLIAKVLASPAALQAFDSQGSSTSTGKPKAPESSQGGQDDDLLAPPEEFDWGSASPANGGPAPSASTAETTKPTATKPQSVKAPTTQTPQKPSTQQSSSAKVATGTSPGAADAGKVDDEAERRKKRAARFGIPLVEVKPKAVPVSNGAKASPRGPKPQAQTAEEAARLEARAARFGMPKATSSNFPTGGQKRARSPAPADKEEMERRKKRAERFSTGGESNAQA